VNSIGKRTKTVSLAGEIEKNQDGKYNKKNRKENVLSVFFFMV
jgi:translation initiation factor RLI1